MCPCAFFHFFLEICLSTPLALGLLLTFDAEKFDAEKFLFFGLLTSAARIHSPAAMAACQLFEHFPLFIFLPRTFGWLSVQTF
jgi:hypothetical protein